MARQLIGGPIRHLSHAKGIYFQFPTREVDLDPRKPYPFPSREVRIRGANSGWPGGLRGPLGLAIAEDS